MKCSQIAADAVHVFTCVVTIRLAYSTQEHIVWVHVPLLRSELQQSVVSRWARKRKWMKFVGFPRQADVMVFKHKITLPNQQQKKGFCQTQYLTSLKYFLMVSTNIYCNTRTRNRHPQPSLTMLRNDGRSPCAHEMKKASTERPGQHKVQDNISVLIISSMLYIL